MTVRTEHNTATLTIDERSPRVKNTLWFVLAFLTSLMLAGILIVSNGSYVLGTAFVAIMAVVVLTVYRLDWGFLILIFASLVFDQHPIPFVDTITVDVNYFTNLNMFPGVAREAILTPMELHSLLVLCVWLVTLAVQKNFRIVPIPKKGAAFVYFLMLAFGWIYGMATGGDPQVSFWEIRAMVYLCAFTWWTPQIIRTKDQLQSLFWVIIAGVSVKAIQGTYRFAANGFSFRRGWEILETFTSHEDPLFMILLFFFLGGLLVFNVRHKQRTTLLWMLPVLLTGYIAAQRRATYASFMASSIIFFMLLPKKQKIFFSKVALVFGIVFGIYLAAFWTSTNRIGTIAQQFKATVTDEAGARGQKDITSTLYRKAENFNLVTTIRHSPVIGIGYGKPFERPLKPWGSVFPLSDYIPHNQIFWIFAKIGIIGGFCFWFMFNTYMLQGAMIFYKLADPYLKAVCAVCVISIANQLVVSSVDMQLTFYRNMVILGVMMGTIQVLDHWVNTPAETIAVPSR